MPARAVVMIGRRALLQDARRVLAPVRAQVVQRTQEFHRRGAVGVALLAPGEAGQLQQAASRASARDVVDALLACGLAEIAVRQAVLADVADEVLRAFARHVQVLLLARVDRAEREAVQRPGLAAAPAGALAVTLARRAAEHLAILRIEDADMAAAAVLAQELADGRIGVDARDFGKARIAGLLRRPVQQRQIHHAVDDRIACAVRIRPGTDEALRIEAAGENRRRMQRIRQRLRITRQPVVRAAGEQIHEAHVVIEQIEAPELVRQQLLHAQRLGHVDRLARRLVQLPHDSRPEAAGPPAVAVKRGSDVFAALALVGNDPLARRQLRTAGKLCTRPFKRGFNPCFHDYFTSVGGCSSSPRPPVTVPSTALLSTCLPGSSFAVSVGISVRGSIRLVFGSGMTTVPPV